MSICFRCFPVPNVVSYAVVANGTCGKRGLNFASIASIPGKRFVGVSSQQ